ncbi:MAG: response regulator [Methanotrichaceae archaeon]|jgi:DNA-binding NtrC family response regulator
MDKKFILVVDDDKRILKGFSAILELKGYRVSTAESGQEAIKKYRANYYNLVLIDIKLPDLEGTELIKQFNLINPGAKKIMVTGYATLENAIKSLNWGADGYLQKPVPPSKLLSFVADKLMEQEVENDLNEDMVIDLLRAKKQDEQNLDRWT